jgi:CubicO group peptidase (beta-lactamase class C family)
MSRRYVRALPGALAIILVVSAQTATGQSREPYPGLDAYVSKAIDTWKIPGLSIAIVRNDSVIYARGFGVQSVETRTPVNERTLFEIGSSSKAFTATLIAMLVGEGKMHFDDRITTYLPEFRMYDPVANEAVTIRDALTHRSGIARGELAWLGSGISRDEVLHRVRFLKPEAPFRSHYSYQNMMILAAGQAAAKAAGSTWDDLVRQRIFTPLGMASTVTTYKGLANPNVATPHGLDHDTVFAKPPFDAENIAPAGAVISSALDMAQWLRFQLNDGVVGGRRLVASAALRETHTPQILIPPTGGRGGVADTAPVKRFTSYGMGWMVEDYRNNLSWQHGGNTLGMTAAVGLLPEKKIGVVVLSNMQGAQLPELLEQYVFDRALGAPTRDWSAEAYARYLQQRKRADSVQTVQLAGHVTGAQSAVPLSAFAGIYADSLYGEMTVTYKDGRLELARGDIRGPLAYWNANNFRWILPLTAPTGPTFIKFEIAADNTVSGLYFGLGSDVMLLGRKNVGGRGGRGATAGAP